ncbi:hypothetical protein CPLU01_02366 [Colletotrichum plurivorum]|uniref:Uncharacterized protein n=1 Tax=Colletotrichum plurivorum TaxID=2175906 RepID=A0A8H6NMZ6_9PEZI|nr:hypothetical protein CPLU01_02366 [Colletotrichum plurivorum]
MNSNRSVRNKGKQVRAVPGVLSSDECKEMPREEAKISRVWVGTAGSTDTRMADDGRSWRRRRTTTGAEGRR